jgi:hypothetical protein
MLPWGGVGMAVTAPAWLVQVDSSKGSCSMSHPYLATIIACMGSLVSKASIQGGH